MNKAFTMIEIIFVIVIISILAVVLIPRLMTTRDDSKIATCLSDINIIIEDLATYYTSQSKFSTNTEEMTNVKVVGMYSNFTDVYGMKYSGTIGYVCQNIHLKPAVNFSVRSVLLPSTSGYEHRISIEDANSTNNLDKQLIQQMKRKSLIETYAISGLRIKN